MRLNVGVESGYNEADTAKARANFCGSPQLQVYCEYSSKLVTYWLSVQGQVLYAREDDVAEIATRESKGCSVYDIKRPPTIWDLMKGAPSILDASEEEIASLPICEIDAPEYGRADVRDRFPDEPFKGAEERGPAEFRSVETR
ncbi:hypothetical protein BH11ARM2_BH11ARM2_11110 [soil metagenome]